MKVQKRLRREMRHALSLADVLVAPTTPFPPFVSGPPADPAALLLNDVLTVPVSLAGVPAISIPVATAPVTTPHTSNSPKGLRDDVGGVGIASDGTGGEGEVCRLPLGMQVCCSDKICLLACLELRQLGPEWRVGML